MSKDRSKADVVLAEASPQWVNGVSVAMGQIATDRIVTIQFFVNYPDPRDMDPESTIHRFLPPIMMPANVAEALSRMIADAFAKQQPEKEEGASG